MILEIVALQDLLIGHAYFVVIGGNNNLNVIYESPLFNAKLFGKAPKCSFQLNNEKYKHGYYLAKGYTLLGNFCEMNHTSDYKQKEKGQTT